MTIAQFIIAALADPNVRAALREALAAPTDEWIPVARIAKDLDTTVRAILEAGRRGEVEIGGPRGTPVIRRSERDRWLAESGRVVHRDVKPEKERDDVKASVARTAARLRRVS